jgi:hypothetical protein
MPSGGRPPHHKFRLVGCTSPLVRIGLRSDITALPKGANSGREQVQQRCAAVGAPQLLSDLVGAAEQHRPRLRRAAAGRRTPHCIPRRESAQPSRVGCSRKTHPKAYREKIVTGSSDASAVVEQPDLRNAIHIGHSTGVARWHAMLRNTATVRIVGPARMGSRAGG